MQSLTSSKRYDQKTSGCGTAEASFSNKDNVEALIQLRGESKPDHLKDDFYSRIDPSIFTSTLAPVFLDRSNKTS